MATNIDPVQTFKVIVIGDSGVGKSSLMNRYAHGVFNTRYTATIGVDFQVAIISIGDYKCRLQIWDTAGQERYRAMTSTYYRSSDGIIIVYDVTNRASFEQVKVEISNIERYCATAIPIVLVGNKDDKDIGSSKVISTPDACEYAQQNHLPLFETSVKDNKNITEVFDKITRLALEQRFQQPHNPIISTSIEQKSTTENVQKKKCCAT